MVPKFPPFWLRVILQDASPCPGRNQILAPRPLELQRYRPSPPGLEVAAGQPGDNNTKSSIQPSPRHPGERTPAMPDHLVTVARFIGFQLAAQDHRLRARARLRALPGQAEGIRVPVEEGFDRVRRSRQEADRRAAEQHPAVRDDPVPVQRPQRARHLRRRAGHHQRHHQDGVGPAAEGVLHAGPRREGHRFV